MAVLTPTAAPSNKVLVRWCEVMVWTRPNIEQARPNKCSCRAFKGGYGASEARVRPVRSIA